MNTKYIIKDEIIYFNWTFDEPLDNYTNIIKNCSGLIFSDYDNYMQHIGNRFNQPLTNSLDHQTQLTQLTFGSKFNHPLNNSLNQLVQLTQLTFGHCFNQPLTNSIDQQVQLSQLTFGYDFNQPLTNLLAQQVQLSQLTLGYKFNQELNIPSNIKKLKLNCNNINLIENLPNSIEELDLGKFFNLELNNLPNSIKIISIDRFSKYNQPLTNLPHFLEKLYLPIGYNKVIKCVNSQCVVMIQKKMKNKDKNNIYIII